MSLESLKQHFAAAGFISHNRTMNSRAAKSVAWSPSRGSHKIHGFAKYHKLGNQSNTQKLEQVLLESALPQSGKDDRRNAQQYGRRHKG